MYADIEGLACTTCYSNNKQSIIIKSNVQSEYDTTNYYYYYHDALAKLIREYYTIRALFYTIQLFPSIEVVVS